MVGVVVEEATAGCRRTTHDHARDRRIRQKTKAFLAVANRAGLEELLGPISRVTGVSFRFVDLGEAGFEYGLDGRAPGAGKLLASKGAPAAAK